MEGTYTKPAVTGCGGTTTKPNLPPLPNKTSSTTNRSTGSYGAAYSGGGGGMAAAIAYESMLSPLNRWKK